MEKQYYEQKITTALLAFSLALAFLIGYVLLSRQAVKNQTKDNEKIISDSFGTICEIICSSDESVVLRRSGEEWECVNSSLPVDNGRVDKLCSLLFEMESTRVLEGAQDYYDTFGFNSPTCTLTVRSDKNEVKLRTGMYNVGTDTFYLINDAQPDRVYLIREKYVAPFILSSADIVPGIEKDLPAARDVLEVELVSSDAEYSLKKADTLDEPLYSSSYRWAVEGMYLKPSPGYDNRISAFIDTVLSLGESERVSFYENGGAMSTTGLSESSRVVLTYSCDSGRRSTQLVFSAPTAEGSVYFTDNNDELLYRMGAKEYAAFAKYLKPAYVMAKHLCMFAPEELKKVCVYGNSINSELNISHGDETKYTFADGNTVDTEKAEALLSKIHSLPCEGYLPQGSIEMPEHIADKLELDFTTSRGDMKLTLEMYDYNFYVLKIDAVDSALVSKVNVSELKQLAASLYK